MGEHSDLMKEELREAKEEIELKERRQKEMELKMKKEMDEKIKKMREEENERIKRIEDLQHQVVAGKRGDGDLFGALGRAIDDILPTTGKLLGGLITGAKR